MNTKYMKTYLTKTFQVYRIRSLLLLVYRYNSLQSVPVLHGSMARPDSEWILHLFIAWI